MNPHLHPTPAIFITFTVIIVIVVSFPAISCQESRPYDVCGDVVKCGDFQLHYPFWGSDRPAYCGHPGFQLTCEFNVSLLSYQSVNYQILDTDTSTQTINMARNDLWYDICPEYLYNTSFNSTLFAVDSSGQENVSLYYGCNTSTPMIPLGANHLFSCNVNGSQSDGYFLTTNQIVSNMTNFLEECQNSITVPVKQSFGGRLGSQFATADELRSALMAGFDLIWIAKGVECNQCMRSNGRCGSNSTSPELFACYCDNGIFSLTCNNSTGSGGIMGVASLKVIIGISSAIAGILIMLLVMFFQIKRWKNRGLIRPDRKPQLLGTSRNHQIEIFIRDYGPIAPNRYRYSEIKKMTNSFVEKLGQGGYGSVYKGQLPDGQLVAVKLLGKAMGDGEDFINEIGSIGKTSHVNIVTLLGFCFDGNKRALIYEFMPNGSLDKFLRRDESHLNWNTLFRIAKGIARGLEYLHEHCNTRIVHFDIKPHNILLDEEFVPKISDFGLAKLCKRKESIVSVTGARGTAGYMAPEVFLKRLGGASHKSDVYSFGMMVLEMTGACKENIASTTDMSVIYFPDTIYKKLEDGENVEVDGVTTEEEEELAKKMVMVSLWCIQSDPSDRPSISKVVEMLEGSFQSLHVPTKRFWSSPTRYSQGTSASTTLDSSHERVLTKVIQEDIAT
ncbi:unnamed protein product [Lactuca saligna]|uniref:non-specific serine/threonine protein kinase n=1 Tax=Lactuca saligna TaxID=75948 RepID=A0AA35UZK9_LACSI|nr:unnamed protein product [Lactuca saligna]